MSEKIDVKIEDGFLVIRMPVNNPAPLSKSGKSRNLVTTNGNVDTGIVIDGKPVKLGVNAYYSSAAE